MSRVLESAKRDDGKHTIIVQENGRAEGRHVVSPKTAQTKFRRADKMIREQNGGLGGKVWWYDDKGILQDMSWRVTVNQRMEAAANSNRSLV